MPLIKNAPEFPVKTVHFPDVTTALERRERDREALAARIMLVLAFGGLLIKLFTGSNVGWAMFGLMIVGFIATCFAAAGRAGITQRCNDKWLDDGRE